MRVRDVEQAPDAEDEEELRRDASEGREREIRREAPTCTLLADRKGPLERHEGERDEPDEDEGASQRVDHRGAPQYPWP